MSTDARILQIVVSKHPANTFSGFKDTSGEFYVRNCIIFKNLQRKPQTLFNKILDQHFEKIFQRLSFLFDLVFFLLELVNTLKKVSGLFYY